jgi:hypothetical protein
MKRIQLFLLSAAIAGAGSAFIPAEKPPGAIYVKVGPSYLLKSSQTGECVPLNNSACNYELKAGHSPNQESDFIFTTTENRVWQPQ